ncbi:cysteine synthase-like protein [Tanacetum coccineum]
MNLTNSIRGDPEDGIFRMNAENSQEEDVIKQLNIGFVRRGIDVSLFGWLDQGIRMALVAPTRGYRLFLAMPSTYSLERIIVIRAFGAELCITDISKGIDGVLIKVNELPETTPNSYFLKQFENPANPKMVLSVLKVLFLMVEALISKGALEARFDISMFCVIDDAHGNDDVYGVLEKVISPRELWEPLEIMKIIEEEARRLAVIREVPMNRSAKRVGQRPKYSENTFALLTTFNKVDMEVPITKDYKELAGMCLVLVPYNGHVGEGGGRKADVVTAASSLKSVCLIRIMSPFTSSNIKPLTASSLGRFNNLLHSHGIIDDVMIAPYAGIEELAQFCGAEKAFAEWIARAMGGSVPFEEAAVSLVSSNLHWRMSRTFFKRGPKAKELIAEIELLKEEGVNREHHLLTLYRTIFEQCVSHPSSGQADVLIGGCLIEYARKLSKEYIQAIFARTASSYLFY